MSYKVFLVEDEVTTRAGIRDNVHWEAAGFVLCGEAPDGEIALPQIETTQPDVLITDIKMPFMDGLQLCKIIREHMPWMKIIILSGYNDFEYAQTAIKLGVSEYLLKPISVQDLEGILAKVAVTLDQEKSEREYLKRLRIQVEDNLAMLREKFLLRLVTGGESAISAIEQSQTLGLNILAPYYQVILLEAQPDPGAPPLGYLICQQIERLVAGIVSTNTDVLLTKKGMEEFVLVLKGENLDQLEQEGPFLARLIQDEVEAKANCKLATSAGTPQQRLGDLHRSFAEALVKLKDPREAASASQLETLDHAALRRFLESETLDAFDTYFDQSIRPLVDASMNSNLLKHYVILDIVLSVAQFVSDMGGNVDKLLPAIYTEDRFMDHLTTQEQVRAETRSLFAISAAYRDSQTNHDRASVVLQAKSYIASHFSDSNLSLNEVAAQVNFSPNHFSAVFSSETGGTFRDYLTQTRINQAKKLLRTTKMKCSEVGYQCSYNDSHYFSMIFRKNTGLTPQQFREESRK